MMFSEEEAKSMIEGMAALAQLSKVYYDSCIKAEFTPIEALKLTQTVLESLIKNK